MFDVVMTTCECDQNRMLIKHVLLICSKWKKERRAMQQRKNITNLRKLLGIASVAIATIRIILSIDILCQFQVTKFLKKKKKNDK